eukprot:TRINITY_DN55837_c0_g1_i1.p1 TRINITY_DN55837_c0_g1~~TRINITY_DN55837_c0_g1_i1.p1  ORF type:complete len:190 (+),score=53.32 TRINITY_DN55837_c0_g1_i1:67-636(+)
MAKGAAPPSEQLFVRGFPMDATNESATAIFSQYGSIASCKVLPVAPGKTSAAVYLIMNSVEEAKWIVENVNGNVPQGLSNPIQVDFALPRESRPGGMAKGGKGGKGGWGGGMDDMMSMMSSWMGGGASPYGGGSWGGGKAGGGKGGGGGGAFYDSGGSGKTGGKSFGGGGYGKGGGGKMGGGGKAAWTW